VFIKYRRGKLYIFWGKEREGAIVVSIIRPFIVSAYFTLHLKMPTLPVNLEQKWKPVSSYYDASWLARKRLQKVPMHV